MCTNPRINISGIKVDNNIHTRLKLSHLKGSGKKQRKNEKVSI